MTKNKSSWRTALFSIAALTAVAGGMAELVCIDNGYPGDDGSAAGAETETAAALESDIDPADFDGEQQDSHGPPPSDRCRGAADAVADYDLARDDRLIDNEWSERFDARNKAMKDACGNADIFYYWAKDIDGKEDSDVSKKIRSRACARAVASFDKVDRDHEWGKYADSSLNISVALNRAATRANAVVERDCGKSAVLDQYENDMDEVDMGVISGNIHRFRLGSKP